MKIYISGANPSDEKYQSAIDNLQYRLSELGFNVSIETNRLVLSYNNLLQSDYAYFIDGWFDSPNSRKTFETCCNHGIPVLFQKPMPYYADFAKTFALLDAINKITGVSFDELRSSSRKENIYFVRIIYSWICLNHYKIRMVNIARILNRDHSTLAYQIKMFNLLVKSPCNKGFNETYNAILKELSNNKVWDYKSNNASYLDSWTAGDNLYCDLDNFDWREVFGYFGNNN